MWSVEVSSMHNRAKQSITYSLYLLQLMECQETVLTFRTLHSTGISLGVVPGMQRPPSTSLQIPDSCWHTVDTLQWYPGSAGFKGIL